MASHFAQPSLPVPYLHVLDGRIRVKIPRVRRSHHHATRVVTTLTALPGMTYVTANTLTGSVLILYQPTLLTQQEVLDALREVVGVQPRHEANATPHWLATLLMQSLVEAALERLLVALLL